MNIQIVSYNTHAINDGTNYRCIWPNGMPLLPQTQANYVTRAGAWPVFAGKTMNKGLRFEINIVCLGNLLDQVDELKGWFASDSEAEYALLIEDSDNADKQWYMLATPVGMPELKGNVVTVVLEAAEPYWYSNTEHDEEWTITATGDELEVTVDGNSPAYPVFEITPTLAGTSGYAYRNYVKLYNPINREFPNWPVKISLDTAALVTAGKMQSDGDDARLMDHGVEIYRWLSDMNTDHTGISCNLKFAPKIEFTLGANIASSGSIGEIQAAKTSANLAMLKRLPNTFLLMIGSEIFTCQGVDLKTYKVGVLAREQRDTSMAAHTSGDTCRWLEHDLWLVYGDSSATAPDVDDTNKPIIDLSSSSNSSFVYTSFADAAGQRAGSWKPAVISSSGKLSRVYTGNQGDIADPATEMGMEMNAWLKAARWQGESAQIDWRGYFPPGVTEVTSSGEKRRSTSSWPSTAALQRSADGKTWYTEWNETTPVSEDTWTAWTHSAETVSGFPVWMRFVLSGSIAASADNQASMEVESATVVMSSSNCIQVSLVGETASYWMGGRITLDESGDYIDLAYPMKVNDTLIVDCNELSITYKDKPVMTAPMLSSIRNRWMEFTPGVNTLKYYHTGTGNVTINVKWRDRNS